MKRILLGLFLLPLMGFAQSTTVTATITDSDSFVWKNGSYQIQFVPNPAFPGGPYTWTGGTLVTLYQGALNGSGVLSVSLPDNLTITGPGTQWKFTICPNATGGNCFSVTTAVTGSSESLTALLSASAVGPRFSAAPSTYGYGTVEINTQAQPGWAFWNTTSSTGFTWSGSAWVATGGGATPVSLTATLPVVVTPSPTTGTGVVSCPGCTNSVINYGAVPDGSTDNATAIAAAFTASNAVTSGIPTVYFPCQKGSQCQYNYSGSGTSAINPTIATTILCDTGVTLNYTGSAHMMDIGASGLTSGSPYLGRFRITGCRLTDSGTATDDIYINSFITTVEIDNVTWYDSPKSAGATAFAVMAAGDNWDLNIHDNDFMVDNNTAINFFESVAGSGVDSQSRIYHNRVVCWPNSAPTSGCAATSGVGIWVNGWGTAVEGNNVAFMQPDLRVGSKAPYTKIVGNYFESSPTSSIPVIQFGNVGDGATTYVDGLLITSNSFDTQTATSSFLGPTTANDLLTNVKIDGLHGLNVSATQPVITLNNTVGQVGNEAQHVCTSTGTTPPCASNFANLHTLNDAIAPWIVVDHTNVYDDFTRANASLASPWHTFASTTMPAIVTNVITCAAAAACEAYYGLDVTPNQENTITIATVPTGTDQAIVYARLLNAGSGTDYQCIYLAGTGIQAYKNLAGTFTQLGSTFSATTPTAGSRLTIRAVGTVISCILNQAGGTYLAVQAVDSSIASGYAGNGLAGSGHSGALGPFTAVSLPSY